MELDLREQSERVALELCEKAHLKAGQILVVGCSSSEVNGDTIGSHSRLETAQQILEGILPVLNAKGIFLAAQCCEHLNRAIIVERAAVPGANVVNVIPMPKAGGAFATACYQRFADPVAVEEIRADAGLDIGGTLIGMHLKAVAVPLRLSADHLGKAVLFAARTRPKFVGGSRACYDEKLK